MSLKYYKDETARYGSMGGISESTALKALDLAYAKFDMPRLRFIVNTRKRTWSHYYHGLYMIGPKRTIAREIGVPKIEMAPSMMNWKTFLHEFAHHMHIVQTDRKYKALARAAGVKADSTFHKQELWTWMVKNMPREHSHGHTHRKLMQQLVDFFVGNGMITELPRYMKPQHPATAAFIEHRVAA